MRGYVLPKFCKNHLLRLCLHEFKYTGRRHIANAGAPNVTGTGGGKSGTKSMTLPARMQPPDFSTDPSSNHPILSGSNSIGRDSVPLKGKIYY